MDTTARPLWARKYGSKAKYKGFSRLTLQGYIGVGWTYAGDLTKVHTVALIEDVLRKTMPEDRLPNLKRDAPILYRFINEVHEEDLVACHDQEDVHLFIGRFKGPCLYNTQLHDHLHLLREVEWVNPLSISLYEGAKQMLDIESVFWKVDKPQVLKEAYQRNSSRIMRIDRTGR